MDWTVENLTAKLQEISSRVDDVFDTPVAINSRLTTTLGRVRSNWVGNTLTPYRVEFSKEFLETATDDCIVGVIEHEWAHYYVTKTTGEHHGHDAVFKNTCAKMGFKNNKAKSKVERITGIDEDQIYPYRVFCPDCGQVVARRKRRCKLVTNLQEYNCGICGCTHLELI